MVKRPTGGTSATRFVAESGITHVLRTYRLDPRAQSFQSEAIEALGVSADRVLTTVVAEVDGRFVLGIVPVEARVDLALLAAAVGGKRAAVADAEREERVIGDQSGAASPLGTERATSTVVDESVLAHPTVLVAGGRPGLDIELAPEDLIRLTNARVARIARQ